VDTSELVTSFHHRRQALIIVRHQALSSYQSRHIHNALHQRARECGWSYQTIETIDADPGRTDGGSDGRHWFKELVTRVASDEVGIIFSNDVTRLSCNSTDWDQLLNLCGYCHCLIGNRDGVYDPATINGRLHLGLKGQMSERELRTIKARLTAGLLSQAGRGALALALPVGLVRAPQGQIIKSPALEVQDCIEQVFAAFLEVRSLASVVQSLNDQELLVPHRNVFGDVLWRLPTVVNVEAILKNPAYAGSFARGRTRMSRTGTNQSPVRKHLPVSEWRIHIRDVYPPYIDWSTYEKIQSMISAITLKKARTPNYQPRSDRK
jgi:DNA invertase Pin-like site-specific DNA recombinase